MKSIITVLLVSWVLTSCNQEQLKLAPLPDLSEIKFSVIQDWEIDSYGNTIILKNETPGTSSLWEFDGRKSNRMIDTIYLVFKGEYEIHFSAITAGGIVKMPPVKVIVEHDAFHSDEFFSYWALLSGGPGNEKNWVLDIDETGVSRYFKSPLYISGIGLGWNEGCLVIEDEDDCWVIEKVSEERGLIIPGEYYGMMTFNLKGGPHVIVQNQSTEEFGTYFLNINDKTIAFTDIIPLNIPLVAQDIEGWEKGRLINLEADYMQIAFKHKSKEEQLIFNYISKEFLDTLK